ncbi:MAG: hypothetical protein CHH17_10505 [Candidatus Fluviicola riflensis]|nr:MAG: hypothetical protein CHH17_10505 [Candidatus Fluviicola riflensis]
MIFRHNSTDSASSKYNTDSALKVEGAERVMNDVRLIDRVMKFGNSDVRNIPNSNRLKQNKPLILNEINTFP